MKGWIVITVVAVIGWTMLASTFAPAGKFMPKLNSALSVQR